MNRSKGGRVGENGQERLAIAAFRILRILPRMRRGFPAGRVCMSLVDGRSYGRGARLRRWVVSSIAQQKRGALRSPATGVAWRATHSLAPAARWSPLVVSHSRSEPRFRQRETAFSCQTCLDMHMPLRTSTARSRERAGFGSSETCTTPVPSLAGRVPSRKQICPSNKRNEESILDTSGLVAQLTTSCTALETARARLRASSITPRLPVRPR